MNGLRKFPPLEHDAVEKHTETDAAKYNQDRNPQGRARSIAETIDAGLAIVLEGGYSLEVLADSVALVHETFDGREPMACEDEPDEPAVEIAEELRTQLHLD